MKVAVIGANGQLGTDMMKIFGEWTVPLTHNELDLGDISSLKILYNINPDIIINTAAYTGVDDAENYPERTFQVNAIGALNVAKVARNINAINIYVSTDYVFDGKKKEAYIEEDIPNPINVYGLSKYTGEIFTKNYSKNYYIIRVASLYGQRGSRGKGGNFVNFIIEKAKRGEEIKVVNDIFMSPTYTRDVAVLLRELIESKADYGTYHMVNEGFCSWYEFAKEILDILGFGIPVKEISSNELNRLAKRPTFSALRNKRLEELGLKMPHWKDALKNYLEECKMVKK